MYLLIYIEIASIIFYNNYIEIMKKIIILDLIAYIYIYARLCIYSLLSCTQLMKVKFQLLLLLHKHNFSIYVYIVFALFFCVFICAIC